MRRLLGSTLLVMAMVVGAAGQAAAAPPQQPSGKGDGWSVEDGRLVWRAGKRVPMGDAAVEFWAGDKLLGRPRPAADGKSFSLELGNAGSLTELSVRAGGKRIDKAPETRALKKNSVSAGPAPQAANAVDPGKPGPY